MTAWSSIDHTPKSCRCPRAKHVHGTALAYRADHCRCLPCIDAAVRYGRTTAAERAAGRPRAVPAAGSRRRLLALGCVGWSTRAIAEAMGASQHEVARWRSADRVWVTRATAARIREVYDRLWDQPPPRRDWRVIAAARAAGGVPPLAWDDDRIDDPAAKPATVGTDDGVLVDEVAVARATAGWATPLTDAERAAAIARLIPTSRSGADIAACVGVTERTIVRARARSALRAAS